MDESFINTIYNARQITSKFQIIISRNALIRKYCKFRKLGKFCNEKS